MEVALFVSMKFTNNIWGRATCSRISEIADEICQKQHKVADKNLLSSMTEEQKKEYLEYIKMYNNEIQRNSFEVACEQFTKSKEKISLRYVLKCKFRRLCRKWTYIIREKFSHSFNGMTTNI